jgi:hypothetical protein
MSFAAIAAAGLEVVLSHVSTSNDTDGNARRPEPVLCPDGLSSPDDRGERTTGENDRLQPY